VDLGKIALIGGNAKDFGKLIENREDLIVISVADNPTYEYHYRFSPGEVGKILDTLEKEGVEKVVFFGKVEKKGLFKRFFKLDLTAIKMLSQLDSFADDSILSFIVRELDKRGIKVVNQKEIFTNHLAKEGLVVGKLDDEDIRDIEYGFMVAKRIGELGIGQTVVVKKRSVVAVEAVEGTDETITRAGRYSKDFVVVKVKRPMQSDFMDLPVVGPDTIRVIKEAGGRLIAVEAGEVIVIPGTIEIAMELGISVYGVSGATDSSN